MIEVIFKKSGGVHTALEISGHAGYADEGQDIVCAAVTSALLLTVNGVTEVLMQKATAEVKDGTVRFMLPIGASDAARDFVKSLHLHLCVLSEDYPGTINITVMEV